MFADTAAVCVEKDKQEEKSTPAPSILALCQGEVSPEVQRRLDILNEALAASQRIGEQKDA